MAKLSALSTVMTIKDWVEFERKFKAKYKEETGETFKGNVAYAITIGVIQKKKLPDVEDEITLIKLLNNKATDEQAYAILSKWLEVEENKKRGIAGAFSDSSKDLAVFVPMHSMVVDQINNLENTINMIQDAMNQFSKIVEQLGALKDRLSENKNEISDNEDGLGVEKDNTQE